MFIKTKVTSRHLTSKSFLYLCQVTTKETIDVIKNALGIPMDEFCEKELKTSYQAFHYRLKHNRLYPSEVVYIVHKTGKSINELFGKPWYDVLISSPGWNIDEKVRKIIEGMSQKNKRKLEANLGFTDIN